MMTSSSEAGLGEVSVRFTHEVADGMHAAIVQARKPPATGARELPVVSSPAAAACCG